MNICKKFRIQLIALLKTLGEAAQWPENMPYDKMTVEPPRHADHGDLSFNGAMILAKPLKRNPRELAQEWVDHIMKLNDQITGVEIAGPGFINIRLKEDYWLNILPNIIADKGLYGRCAIGEMQKVNVEYVSANPTGPLHIGHARGAVFGDILAALLSHAGFDVTKEYYVNDAGAQIDTLAHSLHARYRQVVKAKGDISKIDLSEIREGLYPGDYLIPVAVELYHEKGDLYDHDIEKNDQPSEDFIQLRQRASDRMLDLIRSDLKSAGIEQEVFTSEKSIIAANQVEESFNILKDKGYIYTGVLDKPKGSANEDWEAREQILFRTTDFGDDRDRAIKKSDGSWTYFAPDIAYHLDKYRRGFKIQVNVFGADHAGYIKRLKAALTALSNGEASLDIKICQLVRFMEGGQPVRMSKRAGNFVTLRDLIDAVGADSMRFHMLTRRNDAQMDFDLKEVVTQSKDNPIFYIQYAHARTYSLVHQAKHHFPEEAFAFSEPSQIDFKSINDDRILPLIRLAADWPRQIEQAALAHEPHRLAFYLITLASEFHALWTLGKSNANESGTPEQASFRFISPELEQTKARIGLAIAVRLVIAEGLKIMGITPLEELK